MSMQHQETIATADEALRSLDAAIAKALRAGVDPKDIFMLVQNNANTTNGALPRARSRGHCVNAVTRTSNERCQLQNRNQVYRLFLFATIAIISISNMLSIRGSDLLQLFASVDCKSEEASTTTASSASGIANYQQSIIQQESIYPRQPILNISSAIAQSDPVAIFKYLFRLPDYDDEKHLAKYRHRHDRVRPTIDANSTKAERVWEDYSWKKLPEKIKAAARLLGYQRSTWDNDEEIPIRRTHWNDLTKEQMDAALLIGYDKLDWTPWCPLDTFLAAEHFHQLCSERNGGTVCVYPAGIVKRIRGKYKDNEIRGFSVLNDTRFFPKLIYWDPACRTSIQENVRRPGMEHNSWCASYEYYEAFYLKAFTIFNANNIVPNDLNVWHNTIVNGHDIRIIDFGRYKFQPDEPAEVRKSNKEYLRKILKDVRDEVNEHHGDSKTYRCNDFAADNGNYPNPEVRVRAKVSSYNHRDSTWEDGTIVKRKKGRNVWTVRWSRTGDTQDYANSGLDYMLLQQGILDAQRDSDDPPVYSSFSEKNGTYEIKWRIRTHYPDKFDTAEAAFLALRQVTVDLRKSKQWFE